jgi:sortase (surface protein transpeptidase)
VRLRIPALGLVATVAPVGVQPDGTMASPATGWGVGWLAAGARPGAPGNAVLDGHLDTATGPAVFWRLGALVPGERVVVDDARGKSWRFAVTAVRAYPAAAAPLAAIFGPTDQPHLNLITCTGTWLVAAHQYDQRLVVYTTAI